MAFENLARRFRRRDLRRGLTRVPGYDTAAFTRLLYVRPPSTPHVLAKRFGLILGAMALAVGIFWVERDNLHDAQGQPLGFSDILYFTMVTITTVGYGDIVPVTERARLMDALLVTPIRLFIWLMFLGIAYEFVWQRVIEDRRMRQLQRSLTDHIIVCGFGYTGSSAAKLLAATEDCKDILIIDRDPERLEEAAQLGFVGLRGDCTRDVVLQQAGVGRARAILFCIRRDEIAALATLTARNLNADIRILAMVKDQENVRLLQRAGAQEVISPSRLAGFLMADAVRSRYTTRFVGDLLSGPAGFIHIAERPAKPEEVGRPWREIPGALVVAVERAGKVVAFWEKEAERIEAGDLVFAIEANREAKEKVEVAGPL